MTKIEHVKMFCFLEEGPIKLYVMPFPSKLMTGIHLFNTMCVMGHPRLLANYPRFHQLTHLALCGDTC